MLTVIDGGSLTLYQEFLDDDDTPLNAREGYPKVIVRNTDREIITTAMASAGTKPGSWEAVVSVPNMSLTDEYPTVATWVFVDLDRTKTLAREDLMVIPNIKERESDLVILNTEKSFKFSLDFAPDGGKFDVQIYRNNDQLFPKPLLYNSPYIKYKMNRHRLVSRVSLPTQYTISASLTSCMMIIRADYQMRHEQVAYRLWVVTPSIMNATLELEDALNKARIENTIRSLQWSQGDLLGYLERGLNMFNQIATPTAFDGTDMRGVLRECWLLCSTYYAICAQLLAEGSLSFDFGGQGVSLNVDRTPQLDSALGRIEARISDLVTPFKKLLAKTGNIAGTGSIGDKVLQNPYAFGKVAIINSPTTRINGQPYYTGRTPRF